MSDPSYLVLGRRIDESIELTIPDSNGTHSKIYIDINSNDGHKVKLGIEAAKNVTITRLELRDVDTT